MFRVCHKNPEKESAGTAGKGLGRPPTGDEVGAGH